MKTGFFHLPSIMTNFFNDRPFGNLKWINTQVPVTGYGNSTSSSLAIAKFLIFAPNQANQGVPQLTD